MTAITKTLIALLLLSGMAFAQGGTATGVRSGASLPAACLNQIFLKNSDGLYWCDNAANAWIRGGPVNTNATSSQFFTAYTASTGVFTKAQPAYSDISGTPQLAQTLANASHKWFNSYTASTGAFTQTQPDYADLTGTPTLPANTTATSSNFFTAYNSTTGAFTKAQPAFSDISGTAGLAQGGTNADLSASGSSTAVLAQDASHVVSARALSAADIPALVTPQLGTPASGVLTNTSGYKWDQLASPGGNQTLTMTSDSTTWNWGSTNTNQFKFDTSGNPTFGLVSATTAVTSSPTLSVCGSYQNAGTPTFAADCWTIQNVLGSGTNGTGILTISQSGTTGARQMRVTSFQSNSPVYAIGTSNTGIGQDGSNNLLVYSGGNMSMAATGNTGIAIGNTERYAMTTGAANGTVDTGISRGGAAKLVKIGNGTANDATGFIKTAQTAQIITADVTCGTGGTISSCVAMQTITGLSVTLPLIAANWSFTCDLIVGQATAAAANQIGVQTATNGATNLAASAIAYTAAATSTAGAIIGVASTTTAQSVITFTPGATGTKMPIHLTGTIEGASASGTVFNVTVLTGAAADLLTIYRGSSCYVY